ncbi:hypothetical protein V490_01573 [Pseudogymnoascus sp. VKM F-3557]|nr:hypothetical protein V490_01573 [Pseudogymnoascus sp. VKM F-3557]
MRADKSGLARLASWASYEWWGANSQVTGFSSVPTTADLVIVRTIKIYTAPANLCLCVMRRGNQDAEVFKNLNQQTPKSQHIVKRLTSSLDAFSFGQTLEYNTPAPGAGNTFYHTRGQMTFIRLKNRILSSCNRALASREWADASMMAYQPPRLDMDAAAQISASPSKMSQAYPMSIADMAPEPVATLYRKSVPISLDGQQQQDPEIIWQQLIWQLWQAISNLVPDGIL